MADENNLDVKQKLQVKVNYGTVRVLKMVFACNAMTMTWNLKYPRNDLTKIEVINGVMNEMIQDNAILYKNSEATEVKDAYIYETRTIQMPAS